MEEVMSNPMPVPAKYYLSGKQCSDILERAASRGRMLPEPLRSALEAQAKWNLPELHMRQQRPAAA